ncbi:MAG: cell wall metabolism sensor histidine kinase WalK [Firmicutes bacterium]|nr:cell wall metabolism sensor histidine kinase WalK [Bacillota bacterium]MCL5040231.1 cell wall metabolism sensor histidine kinase WalK [Bacillota bacterium]
MKSLQWRLALIHLLLILLAMELVNVYLLQSLERYYVNNFSANLAAQAQVIAGFSERYLLQEKGREDLDRMVKEFGRQSGVDVAILSTNGALLATSRENPDSLRYYLSREDVARALAGTRGESIRVDPATGDRSLHLTTAIRSSGSPLGVVYLTASLEGTYRTLQDIRWILLSAALVALVITGVLSFFLARTITGPIRQLTSRAEEIARGSFDQRIKIASDDEIGQLGEMFNFLSQRLKQTLLEISEEKGKMEAILTHMADGLIALNEQGRPVLINPAAARLLGSSALAKTGPSGSETTPNRGIDPVASLEDPDRAAPASGLTWLLKEIEGLPAGSRLLVSNESARKVLQVNTARIGQGDSQAGTVVVLQDVTQQEKLESLRREFVANVSHELKTPLTTIKSYVETLLDGALEDHSLTRRFLQVVEGETNRMVRLVQDLLQLSLMESQTLRWRKRKMDLSETVEEVLAAQAVSFQKKGLTLRQEIEPGMLVSGDRDRIEQVLLNLLSNAMNYTPTGGTVTVGVQATKAAAMVRGSDTGVVTSPVTTSEAGMKSRDWLDLHAAEGELPSTTGEVGVNLADSRPDDPAMSGRPGPTPSDPVPSVLVRVADTGIGIPPQDLERVFERFYRVDKARSRQQGGTGLGLSIAKQIIEAHGGRIGLSSAPGRGTEAFFVLPLYREGLENKAMGKV